MQGNHMQQVTDTLQQARQLCGQGKPIAIIMHTTMGYGVDFMMGSHKWHGIAPNDEQLHLALQQLSSTLQDY
jgi:transketolase